MRPPEFTGGNDFKSRSAVTLPFADTCFNEAAGIHRRKPSRKHNGRASRSSLRFNEAAGIHRRKRRNICISLKQH